MILGFFSGRRSVPALFQSFQLSVPGVNVKFLDVFLQMSDFVGRKRNLRQPSLRSFTDSFGIG
jgi:hypothetical protein